MRSFNLTAAVLLTVWSAVAASNAASEPQTDKFSPTEDGRFGQAYEQDQHGFFLAETPGLPAYQGPPLTVELWAKLPHTETFNVMLSSESKQAPRHWELYANRGTGEFSVFIPSAEPADIRSDFNICTGQWHFLTFVFEAERVRLYVDGEKIADQKIRFEPPEEDSGAMGPMTFGRVITRRGRIPYMRGLIDDVRISSIARQSIRVPNAPMSADEYTVALWDFDRRTGLGGFLDASESANPILVASEPRRSLDAVDRLSFGARPGPLAAPARQLELKEGAADMPKGHAITSLNGTWELAPDGDAAQRIRGEWPDAVSAPVPGSVHEALWKAGEIPNPYIGKQDAPAREMSFRTWWYKTIFPMPEGGEIKRLLFDGVAIKCRIWLNGKELGEHEGMFGGPAFDVSGLLEENNKLVVRIEPAPIGGPAQKDIDNTNHGWNETVVFNNVYGWHYCNIPSLGIWRDVSIEAVPPVRLDHPFIAARHAQSGTMDVSIPLIGRSPGWSGTLKGTVRPENFDGSSWSFEQKVAASGWSENLRLAFDIPEPRLWWPNGLGAQNLYRLELSFEPDGGGAPDAYETTFGIRTVEQAPLPGGPYPKKYNWQFVINGEPMFVKGTGWCTMDPLMDFSYERYERLLQLAQLQNIQMFRAWGAGMPETNAFYDACDRYGVMVLQEWPTAWNSHKRQPYPVLEETVRLNTLRIRNHPSLVMYGGGNESSDPYGPAIDMMGRYAEELDGTRAFHRGDPYGGSIHNYDVYWGRRPLDRNLHLIGDFLGEFGLASMPVLESVLRYTPEEEQDVWPPPEDGTIAYHTPVFNRSEDMSRLKQYSSNFMPQDSLENFVLGSQLAQATGVRHTLERARTRYPECTGALYYKMNDNYPAASWASVDWYGAPKLSHYVFQDAFAPLHACLVFSTLNPAGEPVEQPVFLLDDAGALQNKEWEVRVRAFGPDLQVVKQQKFAGSGGIDKVKRLGTFSLDAGQTKTTPLLTVVEVWTDEEKASRTFYWSNYEAAPGCLTDLPGAAVSMSVDEDAVVLVNEGPTPAVGVHVERPGHAHTFTADDNFLWLDPGESARIAVSHTKGLSLGGWNLN